MASRECFKAWIVEATAVQRARIPPILKGVDVIGTSQTGSGKTAAFALQYCRYFHRILTVYLQIMHDPNS